MRWGENKVIFEEALIGALLTAAVALVAVAAVLPMLLTKSLAALVGILNDPTAVQWGRDHPSALAVGGGLLVTAGLLGFAIGFRKLGWQSQEWHYAGMQLLDEHEVRQALQVRERALFSREQREGRVQGVQIGGVELSRTREVGHIAVAGLPGAGKTVLLTAITQQALGRGDRVLLHDPKGDFLDWIWGDECIVLGPWDARAVPWDLRADINTPERAVTFAGAIFNQTDAGQNQYFVDAAREVFAALVKHLQRGRSDSWGWPDLADLLQSGAANIVRVAHDGDPVTRTLVPEAGTRTVQSILSEVVRSTAWIPAYASAFDVDQRRQAFSFSRWLAKASPAKVVVMNNDARYATRSEQLFSAMLASVASVVSSPVMGDCSADESGLWVIADEYPQLGRQAQRAIGTIEEMGRSRGVRVIKAVQDESQLFAAVGREKGEALRSVQQTRIYLKLATGSAAELSQRLGQKEIMRVEFPHIVGGGNKRVTKDRQPVVRVDELTGLRVRKNGLPSGVEMIIHSDDVLGRLVQPFSDVEGGKGALVPNDRWDIAANVPAAETRVHAIGADDGLNPDSASSESSASIDADEHELRDLF